MDSKFIKIVFFSVFLISCHFSLSKSNFKSNDLEIKEVIFLSSDDLYLLSVFCDSFKRKNIKTICSFSNNINWPTKQQEINSSHCSFPCKYIHLSSKIENSSIDFLRSTLYSILSLTTATIVTTSANIEFQLKLKDPNLESISNWKIDSFGRIGMWAVLPIYGGLFSTMVGSGLNSYRKPSNLHETCNLNLVNRIQKENGEICVDYLNFIQDSFNKKEKEFFDSLEIQLKKNSDSMNKI